MLSLICRTPLLVSNSFCSLLSTSWAWFCPSAGTMSWCLSCLIPRSLWGSVKVEERLCSGQWFSSSSIVAGLPQSLHGFFQFSTLSACLLTFPLQQSFHLLQAQVAQWGVAEKKLWKEKKKSWTQKSLTGWPQRDGVKGWPVIGLLYVVGTPTGREERRAGWENNHCSKQRGRKS